MRVTLWCAGGVGGWGVRCGDVLTAWRVWVRRTPSPIVHLQHDLLIESVNLVNDIINMVQAKGYTFVTAEDCVYGIGSTNATRAFQRKDCALPVSTSGDCEVSEWSDWDSNCALSCGGQRTTRRRYIMKTSPSGCSHPLTETSICNSTCFCGDGRCNLNETCTTCAADCGPCQPSTVGGSTSVASTCVNERDLALTFAAGPTDLTNALITNLASFGANATFFVDADAAVRYASVIARMEALGHVVGANVVSIGPASSLESVRAELAATSATLESVTCSRPR